MGVQFGSFDSICQTAALVICPLLGSDQGIEPTCYSRNVDIAGTLIFQPCESFFHLPPFGKVPGSCQTLTELCLDLSHLFFSACISNMFRTCRRDFDDGNHDLSHSK